MSLFLTKSNKLEKESNFVELSSASRIWAIGSIHSNLKSFNSIKELIINNFKKGNIKILVATTVVEVGIDNKNANIIIIENSEKFGLSQLHQLRGRVGRGDKSSTCILMFKSNLSENAKKRIKILKNTNDGFKISEEDMKLRGYGDLLGFKQSGLQSFRLADPVLNEDLFILAEKEVKRIEKEDQDFKKYMTLLKLYDRADILNDIV